MLEGQGNTRWRTVSCLVCPVDDDDPLRRAVGLVHVLGKTKLDGCGLPQAPGV
jgi:hypothetical protein